MTAHINYLEQLDLLEKAVATDTITAIVPEDLEIEAHNTLWNESEPGELTLLKYLPSVNATQVNHEYTRITGFGRGHKRRSYGFFGEKSLPPESNFKSQRVVNVIRLMGEIGPTFLLAALEKTQRALGTTGAANIEAVGLQRAVLWQKNRALYMSDTRDTNSELRYKGLYQLIEEGTDSTASGFSGVGGKGSPFGSHIIDMRGEPLTVDTVRERMAESAILFGQINCLFMDPLVRADFEGSMDSAQRLPLAIQARPYMLGQNIGGIQTNGGTVYFESDNTLSGIYSRPQYQDERESGGPSTRPTVAASAVAGGTSGNTSLWNSSYAGDVYYQVTEVKDDLESKGQRAPATASTYLTVASGQEVQLDITPGDPTVDSFRVYRGTDSDASDEDAWFIYEVANDGGGSTVTSYDWNKWIPNTTWAFGLRVLSASQRSLQNGQVNAYWAAKDKSASFLRAGEKKGNTVAVAELGPSMGIMELASVLAEVRRPLVYSAHCPQIRNPWQNFCFTNVGRAD
jgi:hypothetical protein